MKPVICFYESETYLYSTDYTLLSCPDTTSVTQFLNDIQLKHANFKKVVQINFDAFAKNPVAKACLYKAAKAQVYVLKNAEVLTFRDIQLKHTALLRSNTDLLTAAPFELLVSKKEFTDNVNQIYNWIKAGRIYQVNLTAAFRARLKMDSLQFFLMMHTHFKGNYKCHLPHPDFSIISFSPELFLAKNGKNLVTAPIKGSASALVNSQVDLIDNQKEEAELSMIVDLLRNDFNSLEITNSARVTGHRQLMSLNYIQHTYSEIQIDTDKSLPEILEKLMPGGSISGCPKKESLDVISELERTQRQAYTGTIGWWHNGDFKLNIAIRTFVSTEDDYFYFAGCGIVYDSDPDKEFAELIHKAGSLNVHYE